jgi:hypothetical protein
MFGSYVEAVTIIKKQPVSNYHYNKHNTNMYDYDLNRVEKHLFKKTYSSNSLNARLNRIERKVFNRCYTNWNPTRRVNHILANYKDYYHKNYLSEYESRRPAQRVINRVIGQPTGFTPSIMDMPFGSGISGLNGTFAPSFSQGFSSNRGYGFMNSIPATMGAGIRILD